jgi:ketosteroid isomerase-like protein
MSQENVELARAVLNWFAQLDEGLVDAKDWRKFATQDVITTVSGFSFVDEQTFRGLEEFLEWRATWMEPYDDWIYEVKKILDAGESQVVVILHQRGRPHGSDSWVEMDYGMVYTAEGGLITRADFYATPEQALEAVGLSE